jgi:CPA1 family monovalent cation:H+ antiporter
MEERRARRGAVEAAIERFEQLASERSLAPEIAKPLRAAQRARLAHIELKGDGADPSGALTDLHDEIELALIGAERQLINDLYRDGKLKDEPRRRIERELDLREAHLANQQDEE